MKTLALVCVAVAVAFAPMQSKAYPREGGEILIVSYSGWMLEIFSDGSGLLILGSGLPNAAEVPKGTYDFNALRQLLPSHFSKGSPSATEEKFCFDVNVSPPKRKDSSEDIVGRCYDRKLLDPLFETALKVGKPYSPETFKTAVDLYPVIPK